MEIRMGVATSTGVNMIETTCCGLVSEQDAALVAHDYPTAHNLPTWLVWASVWLSGLTMALGIIAGLTVAYDVIADPTEDSSDVLLNCYVYGDGKCGPNAAWHGFINL
jgi:hypothetical protein